MFQRIHSNPAVIEAIAVADEATINEVYHVLGVTPAGTDI